jgi:hypothetical protein
MSKSLDLYFFPDIDRIHRDLEVPGEWSGSVRSSRSREEQKPVQGYSGIGTQTLQFSAYLHICTSAYLHICTPTHPAHLAHHHSCISCEQANMIRNDWAGLFGRRLDSLIDGVDDEVECVCVYVCMYECMYVCTL